MKNPKSIDELPLIIEFNDERNEFAREARGVTRPKSRLIALIFLTLGFLFISVAFLFIICSKFFCEQSPIDGKLVEPVITNEEIVVAIFNDPVLDELDQELNKELKELEDKAVESLFKYDGSSSNCVHQPSAWKFDCYPEQGSNEQGCLQRGCCWEKSAMVSKISDKPIGVPYCYYPSHYAGYSFKNISKTRTGFLLFLDLERHSAYNNNVAHLKMEVTFLTKDSFRIKIFDSLNDRYEVPLPLASNDKDDQLFNEIDAAYDVQFTMPWGFQVIRKENKEVLFDTRVGAFIFSDQFIQISSLLPSTYIYGLGETEHNFLHTLDWQKITIFNADQWPRDGTNLYGSHPFYLMLEESSKSHGVLLYNSNAMEIVLQPTPAITYRTIGGIMDFYFFLGPTPKDVIQQYTSLIGRTFLPPYWSLGFHLCRFNYGTVNRTREVWLRNRKAGVPQDIQWNDLDYMDKKRDFTFNKDKFAGLPQFVDELHHAGVQYIPIIDPGISIADNYSTYSDGLEMDVFVKNSQGKPFVGQVWPGKTVWPDFTHPNSTKYWTSQFQKFHSSVPIDGAWIDMNEPSNFLDGEEHGCPNSTYESPQFTPDVVGGYLHFKTICMTAKQFASIHYNVHNLYGTTETIATNRALTSVRKKRPFIISRSTFPGQGKFGGHWTGDIHSDWISMERSIGDILNFNLFGIPMVGADICGFNGNTTAPLCQRWMELGAFYPFSRNHNTDDGIDQDPVGLGPEVVAASVNALTWRYRFLPYLYTLFYRAHLFGETVARPLFFEYSSDKFTYAIDTQFLWGDALMILPVLQENTTFISCYFPKGIWYLLSPNVSQIISLGESSEIHVPLESIGLALRGGSIVPTQLPNITTNLSRKNKFEIIIALNETGQAYGELYWDDGDSLDTIIQNKFTQVIFKASEVTLESTVQNLGYKDEPMVMGNVTVFGIKNSPVRVTVNGQNRPFYYEEDIKQLRVVDLGVSLKESFKVSWA